MNSPAVIINPTSAAMNSLLIGEKHLYAWLREHGYIMKHKTTPTQKAMDMGLFEIQQLSPAKQELINAMFAAPSAFLPAFLELPRGYAGFGQLYKKI